MTTGKILGNIYIDNGVPAYASEYSPDVSAEVYYEVVRLCDRQILFLDDHLVRFRNTLSVSGLEYPGDQKILDSLRQLLVANDLTVGNIRICLQKSPGRELRLLCYFVPYIYPEQCMYLSGVQLVTYLHERPNPGIKKWDRGFREAVQKHIRDFGVYEAILLNEQGVLTEGSRSNLFFIDASDRLVTPPAKMVLPGITRKYALAICRDLGIDVVERPITLRESGTMVSCFITGTSPKILPVWQLDSYQFRVDHPLLKRIMENFESLLSENLRIIV